MESNSSIKDFGDPVALCRECLLQRLRYAVVIVAGICLSLSGGCDRGETPDDEVAQSVEQPTGQEASQQKGALEPSGGGEDEKVSGDDTSAEDEDEAGPHDPAAGETEDEAESDDTEVSPHQETSPQQDPQPGWREIGGEHSCDAKWCRLAPDMEDVRLGGRVSQVNDEIYVGGIVGDNFDGESYLFRYDGSTWHMLALPEGRHFFGPIRPISPREIYVIVESVEKGVRHEVFAFDGTEWSPLMKFESYPGFLEAWPGGRLVVGGFDFRHYDGTKWEQKGEANELMSISLAFGPDDILAWGAELRGEIWHFDGEHWEKQFDAEGIGRPGDVWAAARDEIFVVSEHGDTFAAHYDGEGWSLMETPSPESPGMDARLHGVWGVGSDDVFAVGSHGEIYHYDGMQWRRQDSPVQTTLYDVAGIGSDRVYAVGEDGVVEYDGEKWQLMDFPGEGKDDTMWEVWTTDENELFGTGRMGLYRLDTSTDRNRR